MYDFSKYFILTLSGNICYTYNLENDYLKFNDVYNKHHKIIHHLLKKYNISYNYDEYYQLLLIKMWQLSQIYPQAIFILFFIHSIKFLPYRFIQTTKSIKRCHFM